MILFAVIVRPSEAQVANIANAIRETTEYHPSLRRQNVRTKTFGDRELAIAWVEPTDSKAGAREYAHDDTDVTVLFSGLPIDANGSLPVHRASTLSDHWDTVAGELEGFYSLIRVRSAPVRFELFTDLLGFEKVFYGKSGDSRIFSNSVSLVERLSYRRSLDPTAVSLFIAAGWVGGSHTMLDDIQCVKGSTRIRWHSGQRDLAFERTLNLQTILERRQPRFNKNDAEDLAEGMLRPLRALEKHFSTLDAPITGGRDSRVIFSLLTSAEISARFYTFGQNFGEDAQLARRVAESRNLPHEFLETSLETLMSRWNDLTSKAVLRADGMYPLQMLLALLTAEMHSGDTLPIRIWGAGGGMAKGALQPTRFSRELRTPSGVEALMCRSTIRSLQGLLTRAGRETAEAGVKRQVSHYLDQGVAPESVPDALYAFERVGGEGGQIMRPTADFRDTFSPYCTRAFVSACFSLPPRNKLTHPVHRELLTLLAPDLFNIPFDFKSPGWKPRQAWKVLGKGSLRYHNRRIRKKLRLRSNTKANFIVANDMFDRRYWLEHLRDRARNAPLDLPNSPIWEIIDKKKFEKLMRPETDANERMRVAKGLYHTWTVAEFEHSR